MLANIPVTQHTFLDIQKHFHSSNNCIKKINCKFILFMKSNTFTLIDKKIFVIGNYIILMESHWYLNLSETINLVCLIRIKNITSFNRSCIHIFIFPILNNASLCIAGHMLTTMLYLVKAFDFNIKYNA